jgi:hypothetical protein
MMIDTMTESPPPVDFGDEDIAIVDSEDLSVNDDLPVDEVEVRMNVDTPKIDAV